MKGKKKKIEDEVKSTKIKCEKEIQQKGITDWISVYEWHQFLYGDLKGKLYL